MTTPQLGAEGERHGAGCYGHTPAIHHVVVGHRRHGVARLGLALLPTGGAVTHVPAFEEPLGDPDAMLPSVAEAPALHLHVNDDLLGSRPVETMAAIAAGRRVAVTLHDVPQPSEGPARFARRSATYRELAGLADLVVVSSEHEARCLRDLGAAEPIRVVDHPIDARPPRILPATDRSVGVLGWIHPGKGHADVLEAIAAALPGGTLVALGAPVPGHADLIETLSRQARALGVGFRVTGYLDDAALLEGAGRVAVPVCSHRHVSASGSIGTWMTAGRAPIVTPGPYARGVLDRCPGSLTLAASLPEALRAAARDPSTTLLARPQDVVPTTEQAALRQAAVLREWLDG